MGDLLERVVYPSDTATLAALNPAQLEEFSLWFAALEAEHKRLGAPYGDNLAEATGVSCWLGFFDDGYSAADALSEDLSND